MVTLTHKSELRQRERWHMTVTELGTRKLGPSVEISQPGNRYRFNGRPVIDLGKIVHEDGGENMIVTDGLEFVVDSFIAALSTFDSRIRVCAEGTGTTAPAAGQEDLVTEAARKDITSKSRSGVEGTFSTFFTAAEANDNIKEAGLFGGTAADDEVADSGIMFCRWLVSFDNSGTDYDITFDYVLTPAYS